jgi:hypothetical protein
MTIDNSTFKDEQEIVIKIVSNWKNIYNKFHGKAIINVLQEYVPLFVYTAVNRVN